MSSLYKEVLISTGYLEMPSSAPASRRCLHELLLRRDALISSLYEEIPHELPLRGYPAMSFFSEEMLP